MVLFVDHFEKKAKKKNNHFSFPFSHFSHSIQLNISLACFAAFVLVLQKQKKIFDLHWMLLHGSLIFHFFPIMWPLLVCNSCKLQRFSSEELGFVYRHSALWLESPIYRLGAFSLCLPVPTWVKQLRGTVTSSPQSGKRTEKSLGHTVTMI